MGNKKQKERLEIQLLQLQKEKELLEQRKIKSDIRENVISAICTIVTMLAALVTAILTAIGIIN